MTKKEKEEMKMEMVKMFDNVKTEMREEKESYYKYECDTMKDIVSEQIRCYWYRGLGILGCACMTGIIDVFEYNYFIEDLDNVKRELTEDLK